MTPRSRRGRRLRALLALVLGSLLALALAEAFVRWRYHDVLRAQARAGEQGDLFYGAHMLEPVGVDGLRYRGRPGAHVEVFGVEYRHGALGLRGPEPSVPAPPEHVRVLVLGDSNAYGWGVREAETFPRVLEALLRERLPGASLDVVNAGVPGFDTCDQRAQLARLAPVLDPDVVLVAFYLNDIEQFGFHVAPEGALVVDPLPAPERWKPWLWRSDLYRLLATTRTRRLLESKAYAPFSGRERTAAALAGLAADARALGLPLAIAEVPWLESGAKGPLLDPTARAGAEPSAWFQARVRELGVPFLDLLPALAGEHPGRFWYTVADHHPNALAHARFAEALADFLETNRLPPF